MRVIHRKICHARYLCIKRNVKKIWGARYTLGARYLSKNTVLRGVDRQNFTSNPVAIRLLIPHEYTITLTLVSILITNS